MADICKENVEHVTKLARIKISDDKKNKFTQELGKILNYIDELSQLPTDKVEPISQITNLKNIAREDATTQQSDREKMLQNAPKQENGFIKVKKVFE